MENFIYGNQTEDEIQHSIFFPSPSFLRNWTSLKNPLKLGQNCHIAREFLGLLFPGLLKCILMESTCIDLQAKKINPPNIQKKSQLQNSSWIVEKTCRKPEHFGEMNCSLQRIIQFEQPRISNNNNSNNKKENAPKKREKKKAKKLQNPEAKASCHFTWLIEAKKGRGKQTNKQNPQAKSHRELTLQN